MNYQKVYNAIIENRRNNKPMGYVEIHHVLPKSLGGTDDPLNLVALTAREHFLCHYLLAKMYPRESFPWYKMQFAFSMMKLTSVNMERYFNSRLYEALREDFSLAISVSAKITSKGNRNSQHNTMWICNVESRESKKIQKSDAIPAGWIKGRSKWNKIDRKRKIDSMNELKKLEKVKFVTKYWNEFKNSGCATISDFMEVTTYPYSRENLIGSLKKHIPEYSIMFSQGKRNK